MTTNDMHLVREYAAQQSESAFAALVSRHTNLVYSAALRQTCNPQLAEEITQAVFILLARKAASLGEKTILTGWLYHTTCYVARSALKREHRRQHREQEAYMQSEPDTQPDTTWSQLSPLLDEALMRLGQIDRDALVLRYFQGHTLQEVGSALGASEEAAKKRVNRALEKLRNFFARRGVSSTTAILAGEISAHSIQAAPVTLAKAVTAAAVAKGATAPISTLTLIKGALKIMAWTKAKTVIVAGVGLLLAAGTTTFTIKEIAHHREESVWSHITRCDLKQMESAPPTVSIRPTRFARGSVGQGRDGNGKVLGLHVPFDAVLARAYDVTPSRVLALTPLPQGTFDYIANVSRQPTEALQEMIRRKYGIIGRRETRETDVLLLTMKRRGAPGLKPAPLTQRNDISSAQVGHFHYSHCPISTLVFDLEYWLHVPVINRTGLAGDCDFDLKWNDEVRWDATERRSLSNPDGLKQVLLDQLGLELVPSREPIEMLVVERAN